MHDETFLDPELQGLWAAQDADVRCTDEHLLIESVRAAHRRENRLLRRLNLQEVLPLLVVFAVFGMQALVADERQWALFSAAFLALGVGAFLVGSTLQQRAAEAAFSETMRGELQRSLSQMAHRAWLYRTVGWWYLLPIALGVALAVWAGTAGTDPGALTVVFAVGYAAFIGVLFVVNRRIGRRRYEPEVKRYQRLLADLDRVTDGEPIA